MWKNSSGRLAISFTRTSIRPPWLYSRERFKPSRMILALGSFIKTVQESQEQIARETSRQDAIREANEQIRAQNFPAAIDTLEKSLARAGQSPDLIDLLQLARERYAEQQRQERIRRALPRPAPPGSKNTRSHSKSSNGTSERLESNEIDALLTTAREQRQALSNVVKRSSLRLLSCSSRVRRPERWHFSRPRQGILQEGRLPARLFPMPTKPGSR